jgi:hypothetical protein
MNHSSDHCKRTHTARTHATPTSGSLTAPHQPGGPNPKGLLGNPVEDTPPPAPSATAASMEVFEKTSESQIKSSVSSGPSLVTLPLVLVSRPLHISSWDGKAQDRM